MKNIKFKKQTWAIYAGLLSIAMLATTACEESIPEYGELEEFIVASDVDLNVSTELSMALNMTEYITAEFADNVTYPSCVWATNNALIASVDQADGSNNVSVTANFIGTTSLTVTQDYSFFALKTVNVTVLESPTSISISDFEMFRGVSLELANRVETTPAGTYSGVNCVVEDESIATYKNGMLTAVAVGETYLAITSRSVGVVDYNIPSHRVKLVVEEPVPLTSLSVEPVLHPLSPGEFYTLRATITPENATRDLIAWESSDPSSVSVDDNGVITGVKEGGSATITAYDAVEGKEVMSQTISVSVGYDGMQSLNFCEATNATNFAAMGLILSNSSYTSVDYSTASKGYVSLNIDPDQGFTGSMNYIHPQTGDSRIQYKDYPYLAFKVGFPQGMVNTFEWETWTGNLGRIWIRSYCNNSPSVSPYYYTDPNDTTVWSGETVTPQIYMFCFQDSYFTSGGTNCVENPIVSDEIIDSSGSMWHVVFDRIITGTGYGTANQKSFTDFDSTTGYTSADTPLFIEDYGGTIGQTHWGTSAQFYWAHYFKTAEAMYEFVEAEEAYWAKINAEE